MKKTAISDALRVFVFALCLAGTFVLHGCFSQNEGNDYISKIIDNYTQYEQELSEKAKNIAIEEAEKQPGLFLNSEGSVIAVTSPNGNKYRFYTIEDSSRYHNFDGDVCQIYLTDYTSEEQPMIYELSVLFEFRSDISYSDISYDNEDHSNFGTGVITYYSGNFTPDLSDLTLKQQRTDRWIKSWISAEELAEHYKLAHKYYDMFCSVLTSNKERGV